MSKDRKLRRYRRKDYSEIVDFPVEIVGRDGMVRRYDFEASIRLYQRRMHVAPMRFRDDDLVSAEQGHCRARIEQLRRSFFHVYGWGAPDGAVGPEGRFPEHAGELAGFLSRVLRSQERLTLSFASVEDGHPRADMWFVDRGTGEGGLLLYAFVFGRNGELDPTEEAELTQRAYFELVSSLQGGNSGDAEMLVAHHHAADCGFALTGRADEVAALAAVAPEDASPAELAPTPWDEVRDLVRRGDFPTAFLRCRWLLEGQPWHRDAYAVGAMLGLVLRRASDAEDLSFVGTRYFDRDALLSYYLGLARLHQDRHSAAVEAFRAALELDPGLVVARSATVLTLVERGNYLGALGMIRGAGVSAETPEAVQHRELVGTLWRMLGFGAVSMLSFAVAGIAVAELGRAALLVLFLVLALVMLGTGVFRQRLEDLGRRVRDEDLQLAMRRIQRRRSDRAQA